MWMGLVSKGGDCPSSRVKAGNPRLNTPSLLCLSRDCTSRIHPRRGHAGALSRRQHPIDQRLAVHANGELLARKPFMPNG